MTFIMLINVKMPTIVGILRFISMMKTTYESLKPRKIFLFQNFSFCGLLKFHAQLSMNSFITSGSDSSLSTQKGVNLCTRQRSGNLRPEAGSILNPLINGIFINYSLLSIPRISRDWAKYV